VAVEKLLPAKFAQIKLREDAQHTTFSVFQDIFYPGFLAILGKMNFFNTHIPITLARILRAWLQLQ
jgi:hypothetical protein